MKQVSSYFYAVNRNLMFKFITILDKSENVITRYLVKIGVSDLRLTSTLRKHWYKSLYVHFDNG